MTRPDTSSLRAGESSEAATGTAGRYAIYDEIGAGGMATVHLGRLTGPANFARTVAIKRLHPHLARQPEFVSMFLDEARVAARVRHPNVVATLDVVTTSGQPYLVMDYVQGESLARLQSAALGRRERIPVGVACAIAVGILHGLHAAHEATNERGESLKIVHRDVSPQNVLVGADGVARVLDFGVAKAAGSLQTTREGRLKGKLAYTAPELVRGKAISRAADIYSVGVVLWELLAGERLFTGDNEANVLERVLFADVLPPSRRSPDVCPDLDAVVLLALSRDPTGRFATARAMARAIEVSLPVASPSDVSEWVEALAGEALLERARKAARIESGVCAPAPDLPGASLTRVDAAVEGVERPARVWSLSRPAPILRASPVLAAAVALVVVGALAFLAHPGGTVSAPSRASAPTSATSPLKDGTESSAPAAPPIAIPPAEIAEPAKAPAAPVPRRSAPASAASSLPVARGRPTPAAAAKPTCDPPWTVDEDGLKKYKLEGL
jgi:hypothetical protein